ncbi:FLYWCH-type domain-containing protein [Aphis craccivora]|uniref:FLYWCH-type domain-containing protein n=1 Tax=Aphis craccivora TaxID=307492 RepID=A0A6G0W3B0_APHCR|nr:FLYWCH-type domain-containing protein [Aphis craccivora]
MKYEVASDYAKLALDDIGESNIKTTKLGQMRTTEIRLKELCATFVSGKINISDFLNSTSHNIRKQSNN